MFWIIYSLSCLIVVYLISNVLPEKAKLVLVVIFLTIFLSPAAIELGSENYAPATSIFIYDLIFERSLSFRSLRVLVLTIPINLIITFIFIQIKKRFF